MRDATLDAAAALVAERGLLSVTMSQIAERAGIGRATLYKYFPDVEGILVAWHERQVAAHVQQLGEIRDRAGAPRQRLAAVLEAYGLMAFEHAGTELAASLHRRAHVDHAKQELHGLVGDLISESAAAGELRNDVSADELANYCLHALAAAGSLSSRAAVRQLVSVTLAGLHGREAVR